MVYFIVLILTLGFAFFEELYFRRYLFSIHNIILAGSLPNFLAAFIISMAYMAFRSPGNRKALSGVVAIVIGLCVYECAQLWLPNMVFDFLDIVASFLGGVLSWLVIYFVSKRFVRE